MYRNVGSDNVKRLSYVGFVSLSDTYVLNLNLRDRSRL